MKAGWQKKELGELAELKGRIGWRGLTAKEYTKNGPLFLSVHSLNYGDHVDFRDAFHISEERYDESPEIKLQKDDVLICKDGAGIGKVGIVGILPDKTTINSSLLLIRSGKSILPKFLYRCLSSPYFQKIVNSRLNGATTPHLYQRDITEFPVVLPPLPEQQRIVGILDKAFDGIATAKANAEKNLHNARALFESHLQAVFTQRGERWVENTIDRQATRNGELPVAKTQDETYSVSKSDSTDYGGVNVTKTGGRDATLRHIPGRFALAVGMPKTPPRKGWRWTSLTDLARLESGHTPSRRHPEYWGGSIPWIGIQDARECHGRQIDDTFQHTNALGISNSSARVLPAKTVCLSRTASVGYVVVMGRPMATSQDFVNWVCSNQLKSDFLKYIFLAEGRDLLRFASGAVHQTIYFPEAKAFHVCHPGLAEQARIIAQLDSLREETQRLESLYQQKLAALEALKKSMLHHAFSGQL